MHYLFKVFSVDDDDDDNLRSVSVREFCATATLLLLLRAHGYLVLVYLLRPVQHSHRLYNRAVLALRRQGAAESENTFLGDLLDSSSESLAHSGVSTESLKQNEEKNCRNREESKRAQVNKLFPVNFSVIVRGSELTQS